MAKEPVREDAAEHPRRTPGLVGHSAAQSLLLRRVADGRLAHAWIFSGPRGIGKATLAYRFARHLLSRRDSGSEVSLFGEPSTQSLEVPAESSVFRLVAQGAHPDLITVERAYDEKAKRLRGEISVDDVRRLTPFFGTTASGEGWRVAIVDSVDDLNRNAANALLKILEEPPERGVLILIAHTRGAVLPTIRSRCATLTMAPLAASEVAAVLQGHVGDLDPQAMAEVVTLAHGSPGRAIELAQSGGAAVYRDMVGLLGASPKGLDIAAVHELADRASHRGNDEQFRVLSDLLVEWLASMIAAGASGRAFRAIIEGEEGVAEKLWRSRGLAQWLEVWEKVRDRLVQSEALNLDRKQTLIDVFLSLDHVSRA
ncbi:MAG: DNA polymerase III subunit delta' [Alphaproteobacteria bacterium]|nr:DNA polymerase III subunit delta' [Alphaproteobacteria bacterium]